MTRRRVSEVKVTKADGTVELQPAYAPRDLRKLVGQGRRTETGDRAWAPPWLVAKLHTECPVCREVIHPGDRIEMRGFEQRRAVHHHCAPDWGRRT